MPVVGERPNDEDIMKKVSKKIQDLEYDKDGWKSWLETAKNLSDEEHIELFTLYISYCEKDIEKYTKELNKLKEKYCIQ